MEFTKRFNDAREEWKKTQPQFAALMTAIKREAEPEKIRSLMADAGVDIEEANGYLALRRLAVARLPEAAKYEAAKKTADRLNGQWENLDRQWAAAETLPAQEAAARKLAELEEPRRDANRVLCETKLAAERVQSAKELGLI
jgi:hypothetical protein